MASHYVFARQTVTDILNCGLTILSKRILLLLLILLFYILTDRQTAQDDR